MTEIKITIKDAVDAMEYWLHEEVLTNAVSIKKVEFDTMDNVFTIKLEPKEQK